MNKLLIALIGSVLTFAATAEDQVDVKRSPEAKAEVDRRQALIQTEINTLTNHPWAGEYYEGDGLGVNVTLFIAPESGYVFHWRGCLGLYDRNLGSVTVTNGQLRLSFTYPNKREGFQGLAEEFIPIHWGDRVYLVPANDITGFCNDVNSGAEPRKEMHGRFLLRKRDEQKQVTGMPTVPPAYQPCLLQQPLTAEITKVGSTVTNTSRYNIEFKKTPVTINAGRKNHLAVGMELYVTDPRASVMTVDILQVGEQESEGQITQSGKHYLEPQTGWKLSTRAPWRR